MNPLAMMLGGGPSGPAGPTIQVGQGQGPDSAGDPSEILRKIIQDIQNYMGVEDDEADKAAAAKCLHAFQQILATEQKEEESALGTTPAHKFLRKATAKNQSY